MLIRRSVLRKNRFFGGKDVGSMLYSTANSVPLCLLTEEIHTRAFTPLHLRTHLKQPSKAAHRMEMKIREKGPTDTVEIA